MPFGSHHRIGTPIALTMGLIAGMLLVAAVLWVNPEQRVLFPVCPLHRLTGWHCPGCGGLRAMHHLLHGRWLTAFHCNPLLVTALPLLAAVGLRALLKKRALLPEFQKLAHPVLLVATLMVVVAFGILRNLPFPMFAWMSP